MLSIADLCDDAVTADLHTVGHAWGSHRVLFSPIGVPLPFVVVNNRRCQSAHCVRAHKCTERVQVHRKKTCQIFSKKQHKTFVKVKDRLTHVTK